MKALLILIDLLPVPNSVLHPKSKKSSVAKENAHVDGKEKGRAKGKGKCTNTTSAQDFFLQNSTVSLTFFHFETNLKLCLVNVDKFLPDNLPNISGWDRC